MIDAGLVWSQMARDRPWMVLGRTVNAGGPDAWIPACPTARPARDAVTAGPGQSPLAPAGGGHSSPAAARPHRRPRAAPPAAGRPGPDDDREPARVTTTAGAQDEPSKAMAADLRHQAQREARVRADRGDDDPRSGGSRVFAAGLALACRLAGRHPAAAGLLPASPAPTPAPLRIRLQHLNFAKITSASPRSIRHRKAWPC